MQTDDAIPSQRHPNEERLIAIPTGLAPGRTHRLYVPPLLAQRQHVLSRAALWPQEKCTVESPAGQLKTSGCCKLRCLWCSLTALIMLTDCVQVNATMRQRQASLSGPSESARYDERRISQPQRQSAERAEPDSRCPLRAGQL